jgi:hypothetical protein
MVFFVTKPLNTKSIRKYGSLCKECLTGEEMLEMKEELIYMQKEAWIQFAEIAVAMSELQ